MQQSAHWKPSCVSMLKWMRPKAHLQRIRWPFCNGFWRNRNRWRCYRAHRYGTHQLMLPMAMNSSLKSDQGLHSLIIITPYMLFARSHTDKGSKQKMARAVDWLFIENKTDVPYYINSLLSLSPLIIINYLLPTDSTSQRLIPQTVLAFVKMPDCTRWNAWKSLFATMCKQKTLQQKRKS